MKMKRLLLPMTVCTRVVVAGALALLGFRRYVDHCYVASWIKKCQPNMTVEEVFSVLPNRFHRDCPLEKAGRAIPYLCWLPSDCAKVEIGYVCRLRSDVDRLALFLEGCSLYFDNDRRLVGIGYLPHDISILDDKAWKHFIHCREPHVPKEHVPTNNVVVVSSCNESVAYMPVKDWYRQKDKWK